jgi:hypothetical protein
MAEAGLGGAARLPGNAEHRSCKGYATSVSAMRAVVDVRAP